METGGMRFFGRRALRVLGFWPRFVGSGKQRPNLQLKREFVWSVFVLALY
jgi:hypothetical protein